MLEKLVQKALQGEPGIGVSAVEVVGDSLVTTLDDGTTLSSEISSALGSSSSSSGVKLGFSESTSWTCPDGVTQVTVELWGGAGGSGSSSGYSLYSPGTSCFISATALHVVRQFKAGVLRAELAEMVVTQKLPSRLFQVKAMILW